MPRKERPSTEKPIKYRGRFHVDVRSLGRNEEFSCPRCGVVIDPNKPAGDPDKPAGETYALLGVKMKGLNIHEIIFGCNNCYSRIYVSEKQ